MEIRITQPVGIIAVLSLSIPVGEVLEVKFCPKCGDLQGCRCGGAAGGKRVGVEYGKLTFVVAPWQYELA